ncbi:hypothetical protein B296_00023195 [Ensete ventricosum]|uniref:Uncharacterized protein n=1 Tax=Ensete ventricosum TaxID=4639 RepID=A0A426XSI3_ENSVE|nr:hypothetical protein B296_00023195 [Ensete ventricosum]
MVALPTSGHSCGRRRAPRVVAPTGTMPAGVSLVGWHHPRRGRRAHRHHPLQVPPMPVGNHGLATGTGFWAVDGSLTTQDDNWTTHTLDSGMLSVAALSTPTSELLVHDDISSVIDSLLVLPLEELDLLVVVGSGAKVIKRKDFGQHGSTTPETIAGSVGCGHLFSLVVRKVVSEDSDGLLLKGSFNFLYLMVRIAD